MISAYVTLGPSGLQLHRRTVPTERTSGRSRKRIRDEILLSPLLYVSADEAGSWPDESSSRLTARADGKSWVTSKHLLTTVCKLTGQDGPVSLIPSAALLRTSDLRTHDHLALTGLCGNAGDTLPSRWCRLLDRRHHRERFQDSTRRSQWLRIVVGSLACAAALAGVSATGRMVRESERQFLASTTALERAERQALAARGLAHSVEAVREDLERIDRFSIIRPGAFVSAVVASLPESIHIQRIAVDGEGFSIDTTGDGVVEVRTELEALPLAEQVTVSVRTLSDGQIRGQIRGRFEK